MSKVHIIVDLSDDGEITFSLKEKDNFLSESICTVMAEDKEFRDLIFYCALHYKTHKKDMDESLKKN